MGTGDNPGGVFSLSKGMMFVNGTAPFVYSGVRSQNTDGAFLKTITPVVNFSNYNPPTADTVLGLDHYIRDTASHKYTNTRWDTVIRFYGIGLLELPQNGRQGVIKLSACQGYQIAPSNKSTPYGPQNYCCEIYVYSSNAETTSFPSIALAGASVANSGCFHWGFVSNNTRWARPVNVYLAPDITDPLNKVTVWVESTPYWGTPMITVQTNGMWFTRSDKSATLPNTGYITLPFNTISTVYFLKHII